MLLMYAKQAPFIHVVRVVIWTSRVGLPQMRVMTFMIEVLRIMATSTAFDRARRLQDVSTPCIAWLYH